MGSKERMPCVLGLRLHSAKKKAHCVHITFVVRVHGRVSLSLVSAFVRLQEPKAQEQQRISRDKFRRSLGGRTLQEQSTLGTLQYY